MKRIITFSEYDYDAITDMAEDGAIAALGPNNLSVKLLSQFQ